MKELALHILDVAENSVTAGAKEVAIGLELMEDRELEICISDNGKGMNREELARVSDPFFTSRTTRKVGLGIPLFRQHAEMAGGRFAISSEAGIGTRVWASFMLEHPDRQPLGDLEGVWLLLASSHPYIDWELKLRSGKGGFSLGSDEIKRELGLEQIAGRELTESLKRLIRNNMEELGFGRENIE